MASVLSDPRFHVEQVAIEYVEAKLWPDGPTCPFCGATKEHVGRLNGKSTRPGLCKCYACRKPFTVKIGTIFEKSHVPLHVWLQAMHLLCASKKGFSTTQLQRVLNVSMQTAWFLSMRIREAMDDGSIVQLGGEGKTVEIDETFVGGKAKNMHANKRKHRGTGGAGKEAVFSLVERGGRVRSRHVPSVNANTLRPIIQAHVEGKTLVMSDEGPGAKMVASEFKKHDSVNHGAGEYVRDNAHINTAENYFSILKRGIIGTYHHVSQEHLHRYLAEFDFRYNNRIALGINDVDRADVALRGVKGKRLTYATPQKRSAGKARPA